jgi:hypothetical protein
MSIMIQLSRADVQCLLRHIPLASDISRKLRSSDIAAIWNLRPIGSSNVIIECSEDQAVELLRIANESCSDAVHKIRRAMTTSDVSS